MEEEVAEEIKVTEFFKRAAQWLAAFRDNQNILSFPKPPPERTEEEWFELFLKWIEWKTDLHDVYWKNFSE